MLTSAIRTWPCASRSTSSELREILGIDVEHEAFGDHRHAVAAAVAQALDDRADERVDDRLEADRSARELLRDQRQRRARGLADAEREVSGLAAHRDHEVPARRRLRVDHQVLDDLDADVARRLESRRCRRAAAGRDRCRSSSARARRGCGRPRFCSSFIAENAVSSPPIVMSLSTPSRSKRDHRVLEAASGSLVGLAREMPMCEPPRKWMRLTSSIVSGITWSMSPLHEPLEAVADAEHLDAFERPRIVAAPMTLLMPGAGPPPTRILRDFT